MRSHKMDDDRKARLMSGKPSVLVLDDDDDVRMILSELLTFHGYRAICAENGKEALAKLKEEHPPVGIIDLMLPDIGGLEIIEKINRSYPDVKCIVLTAYASQDVAIKAVNLGAYSFLQKPYDADQLLLTIRRAFEKHEAEKDLAQKVSELEKLNRELKATQAELIQAGKLTAMGQMAAEIAHEINSPLGAIRVHADGVIEDIENNEFNIDDAKESLNAISSAVVKVSDSIRNLRVFSRRSDASASRLDIHDPLRNVIEMLRASFEKNEINVVEEYCDSHLMMWGNCNELEQIFTNLLLNAKDALRAKRAGQRTIVVRTTLAEGESFRVEVEDSGCGMDPEVKEKIFEAYFTTKGEDEGVGLGLAIVQRIVSDHKGKIELESELGKGTKFILSFPMDRRSKSEEKG